MTHVPPSTVIVPGLQTLAKMQESILSWVPVNPDDENRSDARDALNDGIDLMNSRQLKRVRGVATITLVVSTASYDLPSDFKAPINCIQLNSDGNRDGKLGFVASAEMEERYQYASSESSPCAYTVYDDAAVRELTLNYTPTSGYVTRYPQLRLTYSRRIPHMVNPTDVVQVVPEWNSWLKWQARATMASSRDPKRYQIAAREAAFRWDNLLTEDNEADSGDHDHE